MKLRVRELREERGWNQTVLGYHAGLSPSQISLIETGKRNPSAETLQGIATALAVEVGDLFPKVRSPQPEREAAANSKALQEAIAIAWRLLAQQGKAIVDQSVREGASEQLSKDLKSYHADAARLASIRRQAVGVRVTDELADAEDAYYEIEKQIQTLLRQDIEGSAEEKAQLQRFKRNKTGGNTEERGASAS